MAVSFVSLKNKSRYIVFHVVDIRTHGCKEEAQGREIDSSFYSFIYKRLEACQTTFYSAFFFQPQPKL